jgi:hypothetical protein
MHHSASSNTVNNSALGRSWVLVRPRFIENRVIKVGQDRINLARLPTFILEHRSLKSRNSQHAHAKGALCNHHSPVYQPRYSRFALTEHAYCIRLWKFNFCCVLSGSSRQHAGVCSCCRPIYVIWDFVKVRAV